MRKQTLGLALAGCVLLGTSAAAGEDEGYMAETLSAEEAAEMTAAFEKMLAGELPSFEGEECQADACSEGCSEECEAGQAKYMAEIQANPTAYYAGMVSKSQAAWDFWAPMVEERFGKVKSDQRETLLDLVAYVPFENSAQLASGLYEKNAKSFSLDHVLAFALKKGEGFEAQLEKLAKDKGSKDIRPAAYLALRGNDVGKSALKRAVKKVDFSEGSISQPMLAALALEELGEKDACKEMQQRVLAATLKELDAGNLERARALTAEASFFGEMASSAKYVSFAWMDKEVSKACEVGCEELLTADQVFERIESVTPM